MNIIEQEAPSSPTLRLESEPTMINCYERDRQSENNDDGTGFQEAAVYPDTIASPSDRSRSPVIDT